MEEYIFSDYQSTNQNQYNTPGYQLYLLSFYWLTEFTPCIIFYIIIKVNEEKSVTHDGRISFNADSNNLLESNNLYK